MFIHSNFVKNDNDNENFIVMTMNMTMTMKMTKIFLLNSSRNLIKKIFLGIKNFKTLRIFPKKIPEKSEKLSEKF